MDALVNNRCACQVAIATSFDLIQRQPLCRTSCTIGWQRVQKWGGVVKDPQTGLVDFYGRVDGKLVWLCWRYGEDSLSHYHDLEAGFSARRPLTADVRRDLLN